MKKKFITLLLAICMILPCSIAMTGCNKDNNEEKTLAPWEISKAEWELVASQDFQVYNTAGSLEDGDLIHFSFGVDAPYITYSLTIKDTLSENAERTLKLKKSEDLGQYLVKGHKPEYLYEFEHVTEEYWESFQCEALKESFIELNTYVTDNYNKFSTIGFELDYSYTNAYTMNTENITISESPIEKVVLFRQGGCNLVFYSGDKQWEITFANPLQPAINKLLNGKFYISGGPSKTDMDYAEYYFDGNNGFRMYTPNNTAIADRTDIYYKNNGDGTFTTYTKLTSGGWKVEQATQQNFDTVVSAVKEQYLPFINYANSADYFYVAEHEDADAACPYIYRYENEQCVRNIGAYTYYYSDLKMLAYPSGIRTLDIARVYSLSWKMKFTQGQASSAEYKMELHTANVEIVYPEVNS